jgi:hypothetical protein
MQKPKAGLLSPKVAELVADLLAEVDREDPVPVADYIEMIQSSPIVGAAIELKALAGIEKLGTYSNPEQSYQDFILKCFEVMDGSLPLSVMELLSVGPIGYATSEWAPIQRDKQWVLDRIQIIDPRRYTFRGKSGNIESVVYESDRGNIEIPYDRVIHIVNQRHIAFGSVYGVAECKRGYTAYKAWKIALAAAIIAAKRRGEPILVGFADPGETVQIGTNADGSIASVSGTQALADSLKELENNSVAATSLANRIQTIEAADGALIMAVLGLLEKYQLLAFLVPESVLTATGVGDSNLNKGQRSTLDASIDAAMNQIKERIIEDVVRPLLIWEFGEGVEDFGEFVSPKAPEEGALETLRALTDAILNNIFSASDLDVINRLRELAGLPSVTEIAQGLEPPIDDESIDSEVVEDEGDGGTLPSLDDIAATFAAKKKGSKGGKGKKNCEKGLSCGGTCISKNKTCKKDMTPEQKVKYKKVKKGAGGGGGGASEDLSMKDLEAKDQKLADSFGDVTDLDLLKSKGFDAADQIKVMQAANWDDVKVKAAIAANPNASADELATIIKAGPPKSALQKEAGDFLLDPEDKYVKLKIEKMQEFGMTQGEALAIATWIGNDSIDVQGAQKTKYSLMNQVIYARDTLPPDLQAKVEATNQLAKNGYAKIPSITKDAVSKAADDKQADFDPDAPLQRHLSLFGNPANFVQKYKDSIGKEIVEDVHFATTHLNNLDWIQSGANVTYRVKPRWDGKGQGKYIDNLKNEMSEGEIMYPPGSKFRVKNVIDPSKSTKPKMPKGLATDDQLTLAATASLTAGKGETWQAAFKKKHGKDAYDALPEKLKQAKGTTEIVEFNKKQSKSSAFKEYLKQKAQYDQSKIHIIELEEI